MIFLRSLTPDEREMKINFVVLACALKRLLALACRSHSLTHNIDVIFWKLFRGAVGPPASAATDWSRPWHEVWHDWNARVVR